MLLCIVLCRKLRIQGDRDFFPCVIVDAGKGFLTACQLVAVGILQFSVDPVLFPLFRIL